MPGLRSRRAMTLRKACEFDQVFYTYFCGRGQDGVCANGKDQ